MTFKEFIKIDEMKKFNNHGGDRVTNKSYMKRIRIKVISPYLGPIFKKPK